MAFLKEIKRVYEFQSNTNEIPPFTTTFPNSGTVTLGTITIPNCRDVYLVRGVVNWSVNFKPIIPAIGLVFLSTPGYAQIQFEILKDGGPIAIVTQSLGQLGFTIGDIFNTNASNFGVATLQIVDTSSLTGGITSPLSTYQIRATNIILSAPLSINGTTIIPLGTITAAAGLVSLVVEEVETHRQDNP